MQGYGLVKASRILNCDERTHFMISLPLWTKLAGEGRLEATGGIAGRVVKLTKSTTTFRGQSKPGDLKETAYVNCHGEVRKGGKVLWSFGDASEEGLEPPGHRRQTSDQGAQSEIR